MRFLRTNTACRVTVGPFFDKTDGVTPETSQTVTSMKLTFMVDDGNVPTLVLDTAPTASGGNNDMVHVTGDDAGFYDLELTAANTNYLGRAMLALTNASEFCPVFHEFMILPAMIYDSMILGTDRLDTNVTHIGDTSQTARDIGASVLLSSGTGTGQVTLTSGRVNADITHINTSAVSTSTAQLGVNVVNFGGSAGTFSSGRPEVNTTHFAGTAATAASGIPEVKVNNIAANAITATSIASDAITDAKVASDVTIASVTGAVGSVTGNVGGNVTGSVGSVATGGITAASIATNAIDADSLAADAVTEIQSGLATASALSTAQTDITTIKGYTDDIGTAGAGLTAIPWNASWDAEVQSEVQDAIEANNLDHLVKSAVDTDWATTVHLNSVIGHIADNGTSATFDRTTDSLEALQAEHDTTQSALATVDGIVDTIVDDTHNELPMTLATIASVVDGILTDTGTTLPASLAAIEGDTQDIQSRIPAALVSGRIDASVGAMAANTVTASAVASDAVTEIQSGLATASALATVDTVVDGIQADLDNGTDGLGALKTLIDNVDNFVDTEVGAIKAVTDKVDTALVLDGSVYQFTTNALELAPTGGSAPTAADIADAVWEEDLTDHSGTAGSVAEALAAAGSAGDPWSTSLPGAYGSGTAGKIIGDNINATISSRATQTSVDTIDGIVDAILVDTAEIGAAGAGLTALATQTSVNDIPTNAELATALDALPTAAENATATWAAGTRTLSAFGFTVDTNANATETAILADTNELQTDWANGGRLDLILDARASQTSVDDLPTNAELATALGTADDAVLSAIAALNNLSQANIRTAIGLASANLDTQLADLPTNSELTAALASADDATLAAVAALNNLSSAQVQTAAAAALTAYDPPTRTEATSDANSILTAIDALPTNAELATALGTADDAVLSAISPVATKVDELHKIQGLDIANPMTVTTTSRTAGTIDLEISGNGTTTSTVTRQ